ncbi:MAG: PHP domain-containing protein, partial [Gammaproteobacteria bacterium]|nr:PHP domain-containing protein [Gammaproteobacteria bacterium]
MRYNSTMDLDIDLHSHSLAADGTLTPAELVTMARESGLNTLALTDHDETAGIAEAMAKAEQLGVRLVPGVEVSVSWNNRTIHVVGLQIDPDDEMLNRGLAKSRDYRDWRAEEMGRRLAKHGIFGSYEASREMAKGRIIARTHFARFLIEKGYASDMNDVFKRFLKPNKPGYVKGEWATLEEAVGWINGAGGVAVIAHSARYKLTATKLRELLGQFVECGGKGIEVISGTHNRVVTFHMANLAKQFGVLASVGSDFHDP